MQEASPLVGQGLNSTTDQGNCSARAPRRMALLAALVAGVAVMAVPAFAKPIQGTPGHDEIRGTNGRDHIDGLKGNDEIEGLGGNDIIYGGLGADELDGDSGNDRLYGDEGNDDLDGESGRDKLFGGPGNDELDGGTGNDELTGDAGADRFHFDNNDGDDRITDFEPGSDLIEFDVEGLRFQDLTIKENGSGDTLITWQRSSSSITLEGVAANRISAGDFRFDD
jgi:Ca2+-binding RTX toxin-like protein